MFLIERISIFISRTGLLIKIIILFVYNCGEGRKQDMIDSDRRTQQNNYL